MSSARLFWAAVLLFALFGFCEAERRVRADPSACDQYECRTVYAVWDTNTYGPLNPVSYREVGAETNSNAKYQDIFATTSTEKNAGSTTSGKVDTWKWTECTPHCGKSTISGTNPPVSGWQSAQEISVSGKGAVWTDYSPNNRIVCGSVGDGAAPKTNPVVNNNSGGDTPPGN